MPSYIYHCDACDHPHEEFRSISKEGPSKCPGCGEPAAPEGLFRQDYRGNGAVAIVYGNPTTIGQQGEINARRLGKEKMQMMAEKTSSGWSGALPAGASINTTADGQTPWFRSGQVAGLPAMEKPLDLTKVKNITKYVDEGKTS